MRRTWRLPPRFAVGFNAAQLLCFYAGFEQGRAATSPTKANPASIAAAAAAPQEGVAAGAAAPQEVRRGMHLHVHISDTLVASHVICAYVDYAGWAPSPGFMKHLPLKLSEQAAGGARYTNLW